MVKATHRIESFTFEGEASAAKDFFKEALTRMAAQCSNSSLANLGQELEEDLKEKGVKEVADAHANTPPPPPSDPGTGDAPPPPPTNTGTPPPPPADTGTAPPPPPTDDTPRDSRGFCWDERIHAGTKTVNKGNKQWKNKKGVDKALLAKIEAELKTGAPPATTEPSSAGTPPPPPADNKGTKDTTGTPPITGVPFVDISNAFKHYKIGPAEMNTFLKENFGYEGIADAIAADGKEPGTLKQVIETLHQMKNA